MSAPTIVIVPGLWLGPRPYELLVEEMKRAAPSLTDFVYAPLASTGRSSPGAPTMQDDAAGIRQVIRPLVESGKRLVLVCHSAGALLAGMATEDLEVGQKIAASSGGGGVERFVFFCGGIMPLGMTHPELIHVDIKGGEAHCKDPDENLFHDVDPAVAAIYRPLLKCQPTAGWYGECTYTGWDKVHSSYILSEHDRMIPAQLQEGCAELAKSEEIIRIPTGHAPMLSNPKLLAEKIVSCLKLSK